MGEARVGPADHAVAEGDGESDVGGGEPVREAGGRAAAEVDHRCGEQREVHDRRQREQDRAEAPAAEQIASDEAGAEHDPEADLTGEYECNQHAAGFSTVELNYS
jgi:hypothetical protein